LRTVRIPVRSHEAGSGCSLLDLRIAAIACEIPWPVVGPQRHLQRLTQRGWQQNGADARRFFSLKSPKGG